MLKSSFLTRWCLQRLRGFARDRRGSISILGITMMVCMIGVGGLAIDSMRIEQQRTRVQNALDGCTLMAASLNQQLDPQDVVYDCMDKAGLQQTLQSVEVPVNTISSRRVDTVARMPFDRLFPNVVSSGDFYVNARSSAAHSLSRIEVSLVLDVSASMSTSGRIGNLKAAAKEYVQTVLGGDESQSISISLVPYSGQVNLGSALRSQYNATYLHGIANVNCLEVPDSSFNVMPLSTSVEMPMSAFADLHSSTVGGVYVAYNKSGSSGATPNPANRFCTNLPQNEVRVALQDIDQLKAAIDGLTPLGGTSINLGMRWATALLDPGSQGVFSGLIGIGAIPSSLSGRPLKTDADDALKIVVLMTDGVQYAEKRLNTAYRTGISPIYVSSNNVYSIYHAAKSGANKYYVPSTNSWRSTAYVNNGGTVTQLTWPQVWTAFRASYVAEQFYARAFPGQTAYSQQTKLKEFRYEVPTSLMATQLQSICTLAKKSGIIIYTIAFEAPTDAKAPLIACASSAGHYFDATGLEISSAFGMIATNIKQLKLTQ